MKKIYAEVLEEEALNQFNRAMELECNSLEKVLKEAEKCVILCANCHRLHHHSELLIIKE